MRQGFLGGMSTYPDHSRHPPQTQTSTGMCLCSHSYEGDYRVCSIQSGHLYSKSPKGRQGMSDVSLLCGIPGLSFGSHFLSPCLFFCWVLLLFLSYFFLPACSFSWIFSRKFFNIFSLKDGHFDLALVYPRDNSWSVVCAACCNMAFAFASMRLLLLLLFCECFFIVSLRSFFHIFKNLVSINQTKVHCTSMS